MNIKKSLEDNKAEILKNLPEEFHADFEKSLNNVEEPAPAQSITEVQKEVAASLPDDLKKDAEDISNEILTAPETGATKEEEKAAILASLPDDLKEEFEKNWKG